MFEFGMAIVFENPEDAHLTNRVICIPGILKFIWIPQRAALNH